jgi:hypothetical protein
MEARDLEETAWRLISEAKVASDWTCRRMLMRHSFELARQLELLRQVDADGDTRLEQSAPPENANPRLSADA